MSTRTKAASTMIIYLNDDRAYLYWVAHHRHGFVIDGKRKPKLGHLVVHRATCQDIKSRGSQRAHWTTGSKLKACCLDRTELEAWAVEETGVLPLRCDKCDWESSSGEAQIHLSKLPSEVLEYILEAALIHFEIERPPYHLTVADIAACFGKTPGQISLVLHRLAESGLITIRGQVSPGAAIAPKRVVLPTITAIRTLETFRAESDSTIEAELAKLEPG